jgi:hypothetical protein
MRHGGQAGRSEHCPRGEDVGEADGKKESIFRRKKRICFLLTT